MRIITGTLRGRVIPGPKSDGIRPTSDRTKESMFGIIEARKGFDDARVLDLFAGSGNLGFEAISRGSQHCIFVEKDPRAVRAIAQLAETFGVSNQCTVLGFPIENFLSRGSTESFDLIFADPPYEWEMLPELPDIILTNNWLAPDGWFVLEHDKRHDFSQHPHCVFSKKYGRTIVTIFLSFPVLEDEDNKEAQA